jgi:hypothetical protein
VLTIIFRPSHDRVWELGQEKLPHIILQDTNTIVIENFRNFDWQEEGVAEPRYETKVFSLSSLTTVDVLISHFDDFEGLAHIFLSFGFDTGEHVVLSMETRREVGEKFSPLLGILRQFEIIYVVGSEEDIVGLRTDVRDERVYLYPTKANKKQTQELFLSLMEDIHAVYEKPKIYNTLTHNCTNELYRRVEDVSDLRFPLTWKSILPGYFDEVLYDMEVIENSESFAVVKEKHLIDNAMVDRHAPDFQNRLRDF